MSACFLRAMKKAGAPAAAVDFAKRTGGQGYLTQFRKAGIVDVAYASLPLPGQRKPPGLPRQRRAAHDRRRRSLPDLVQGLRAKLGLCRSPPDPSERPDLPGRSRFSAVSARRAPRRWRHRLCHDLRSEGRVPRLQGPRQRVRRLRIRRTRPIRRGLDRSRPVPRPIGPPPGVLPPRPRHLRRDDARRRRNHRRRHLHQSLHRRAAAALGRARALGLDRRRGHRARRSVRLRRARGPLPARGRRVRLPARGLPPARRLPVRLGVARDDPGRRHRRRGHHVRAVRAAADRRLRRRAPRPWPSAPSPSSRS